MVHVLPTHGKPLTAQMADAILARAPLCLLARIDHPDGIKYFWTGVGYLDYEGIQWLGLGKLGSVQPVKYTAELVIQELSFTLSGVPADAVTWLQSNIRNRFADVWLAALDQYGNVIDHPYSIVTAVLDYQNLQVDDAGTATVNLIARSGFYTLERALDEVHSPEDQRRLYETDTGLDQISDIQRKDVKWRPA